MSEELVDNDIKFHTKRLPSGINEVTAWSLLPIIESKAVELHIKWGIESLPQQFKMEQKKDGAYVSTWIYSDYERIEEDG